jgi:hypothetical protein
MALTPIPDFVWDAKDEADLLKRAEATFRPAAPLFDRSSDPAVPASEPPTAGTAAEAPASPAEPTAVPSDSPTSTTESERGAYSVVKARPPSVSGSIPETAPASHQRVFWLGMALGALAGAAAGALGLAAAAGLLG